MLLVVFVTILGCGGSDMPDVAPVKGKVTWNGQPLKNATVNFMLKDGKGSSSTGTTNDGGEYELDYNRDHKGAMIGDHKVWITTQHTEESDDGSEKEVAEFLPKKYSDPNNTELSATVKAGSEEPINFALEGKEEKRNTLEEDDDAGPCNCGDEVIDF